MLTGFNKISYYDLRHEDRRGTLPDIVGRVSEQDRLDRIADRRLANNCLVVGPGGIGKTALVRGWAKNFARRHAQPLLVELCAEDLHGLTKPTPAVMEKYEEAFAQLPPCVLFIDDFGTLVFNRMALLQNLFVTLTALLESRDIRVVLALEPAELEWVLQTEPGFKKWFEVMLLKNQPLEEQVEILKLVLQRIHGHKPQSIAVPKEALRLICELSDKFTKLGQAPRANINILDESLAEARQMRAAHLEEREIYRVVADKTGIPFSQLASSERSLLKNLEAGLKAVVIGQDQPIRIVATTVQRAKLGLKNARRPLSSFLFLGPSGVGKTETCRQLAEKVFGRKETFVRLDMSEFGQEHTVQRLLGAPPGYIGFEMGGYLTNAVREEPHSLILLDEIEKAHPKAFDIFLQVLEDGRLTSGQGETVDFTQSILAATSNAAVPEILAGWEAGEDIFGPQFLRDKIMPVLTKIFRPEFLNRFDAMVVYRPLTPDDLLAIAKLEIKKVEERTAKYNIRFQIDPEILRRKVAALDDPRFGARPVKRFVEETCETLVAKTLLK